jgi:hypothetical protein
MMKKFVQLLGALNPIARPVLIVLLLAGPNLMSCSAERRPLTLDWFEGKTITDVTRGLEDRGFSVTRETVIDGDEKEMEQLVARHENYHPANLNVRTVLIIAVTPKPNSESVGEVRFSFNYVGP